MSANSSDLLTHFPTFHLPPPAPFSLYLLPWWPSQSAATMVCCLRTPEWLIIVSMVAFGLLELAFHHDQDWAPLCLPAHTGQQHWSLSVYWDCLSPPSSSQAVSPSPSSLLHISLPGLWDLLLPRAFPLRWVAISSLQRLLHDVSHSALYRQEGHVQRTEPRTLNPRGGFESQSQHVGGGYVRSSSFRFLLKSGCYRLLLTKLFWAIFAVIGQSPGTQ